MAFFPASERGRKEERRKQGRLIFLEVEEKR
jgi:hypothetical protein